VLGGLDAADGDAGEGEATEQNALPSTAAGAPSVDVRKLGST
jgi:hypothetical protein